MGNSNVVALVEHRWMLQRLCCGLKLMLVATQYVKTVDCEKYQLAIRMEELRASGIEVIDCRWMLIRGLVEHLSETTYPGDAKRSFRNGDAILNDHSCFILTQSGAEFVEQVLCEEFATNSTDSIPRKSTLDDEFNSSVSVDIETRENKADCPRWDASRQELWFAGKMIKQYRIPSPNQVAILCAFEEEHWPSRIDDPLPPHAEIDPRRRLNDTIRNLNRSRLHSLLRFSGDGSGEGILWEPESGWFRD